jgi:coenzyme F420 hydrogenase subunit beta
MALNSTKATELSMSEDGFLPLHQQQHPEPLYVVPKDLCTRCGACDPICPVNCISFDQQQYPVIDTKTCVDCGLCVKVCPGIDFDYTAEYKKMFGAEQPSESLGGIYESAYLTFANHPQVRAEGSGGGVVTQLLMGMIKEGIIDGALTVGYAPDDPITPVTVLCRTEEELRATAGSKYCVVPHAKGIREIKNLEGKFAFVGVGCQIEGLRKLEHIYKRLAKREIITIGLACHGTLEKEATTELLKYRRLPQEQVKRFFYRGGSFPGKFQIETLDGQRMDLHRFDYKDGAYNYLYHLYTPQRCLMCVDYSAEFADISVSDFWVRGEDGEYLHPEGTTMVMCRTERGVKLLRELRSKGYITAIPLGTREVEESFHHLYQDKRVSPFVRMEWREAEGLRAPNYHLPALELTESDRQHEQLRQATFIFSKAAWTRKLVLAALFSPVGEVFTILKMRYKAFKAARRIRKQMKHNQIQEGTADIS